MAVTWVSFPPNPKSHIIITTFPEAEGKLMKFNVSEMPQFALPWYNRDWYQELVSVLPMLGC